MHAWFHIAAIALAFVFSNEYITYITKCYMALDSTKALTGFTHVSYCHHGQCVLSRGHSHLGSGMFAPQLVPIT